MAALDMTYHPSWSVSFSQSVGNLAPLMMPHSFSVIIANAESWCLLLG